MNTSIVEVPWYYLAMLFGLIAISALTLHKTRKIHLATYDVLADVQRSRKEIDVLFAQIQALFALEKKLGLPAPLPPMRGWAGSPDFLLTIAEAIFDRKPRVVMECSSGVSTLVIARCLQLLGSGHVYSLEHDPKYAAKTIKLLAEHQLSDWATVLEAPLRTQHSHSPWYAEEAIPATLTPIEMLVIDGPPSATAPLARLPALPRLARRLAAGALIIVDDANRPDEVEMLRRWQQDFPQLRAIDANCEKGCMLLEFAPA